MRLLPALRARLVDVMLLARQKMFRTTVKTRTKRVRVKTDGTTRLHNAITADSTNCHAQHIAFLQLRIIMLDRSFERLVTQ